MSSQNGLTNTEAIAQNGSRATAKHRSEQRRTTNSPSFPINKLVPSPASFLFALFLTLPGSLIQFTVPKQLCQQLSERPPDCRISSVSFSLKATCCLTVFCFWQVYQVHLNKTMCGGVTRHEKDGNLVHSSNRKVLLIYWTLLYQKRKNINTNNRQLGLCGIFQNQHCSQVCLLTYKV